MLDLQKRIQEDYRDTLLKRISNRQVSVGLALKSYCTSCHFRLSFVFLFITHESCNAQHKNHSIRQKSMEVERELRIMLKPRPDIQKFSKVLFTAQSIVLVCITQRLLLTRSDNLLPMSIFPLPVTFLWHARESESDWGCVCLSCSS